MPRLTVTKTEPDLITLKDDRGQLATLPALFFKDPPAVGATVLVSAVPTDSPLPHALAHDLLTELLNPPTP